MTTPQNLTNSVGDNGSCPASGSHRVAVERVVVFFLTNVVAHAGSIYLTIGANKRENLMAVQTALLYPVSAGDRAFLAFSRWRTKLHHGMFSIPGGTSLKDATTPGAVAILIPAHFAPLLAGRWHRVQDFQHVLFLDHCQLSKESEPRTYKRINSDDGQGYYAYALPAKTEFPEDYDNYKIYPSSSVLRQAVAVIQICFSSYQLYANYRSSIRAHGLSSPFLIVIPFLLMSFLNLVCNVFINTYTNVTVLPITKEQEPIDSESISESLNRNSSLQTSDHQVLEASQPTLIKDPSDKDDGGKSDPIQSEISEIPQPAHGNFGGTGGESTSKNSLSPVLLQETNSQDQPSPDHPTNRINGMKEKVYFERTSVLNLWVFRISREEKWTRIRREVRWIFGFFGRDKTQSNKDENPSPEVPKEHAIYVSQSIWLEKKGPGPGHQLKHKRLTATAWTIMQRDISTDNAKNHIQNLDKWIKKNYPRITVPLKDLHKQRPITNSILFSGIFFQLAILLILGTMTRFKIYPGLVGRAVLLLVWLFGAPATRWCQRSFRLLLTRSIVHGRYYFLMIMFGFLSFATNIVVLQGLIVTTISLYEAICGEDSPPDTGDWIIISYRSWLVLAAIIVIQHYIFDIIDFTKTQFKRLCPKTKKTPSDAEHGEQDQQADRDQRGASKIEE